MTVDPSESRNYINNMNLQTSSGKESLDIKKLEASVDELIHICESLQGENVQLRDKHGPMMAEHNELSVKKAHAYSKVESLVKRLKILEVEL